MINDKIELDENSNLNVEGKPNAPLCPMCVEPISTAPEGYMYRKMEPDTRWFYCGACDCHYGYHRMKKTWKVSPHDLDTNNTVREHFGLPTIEES